MARAEKRARARVELKIKDLRRACARNSNDETGALGVGALSLGTIYLQMVRDSERVGLVQGFCRFGGNVLTLGRRIAAGQFSKAVDL